MSVAAVASDSTQTAGLTGKTATAAQEMSDRFLKLLVTQLKNQDPMNPMDNAELTSQLAQMSTVEGVNKLNESLSSFVKSSQALQGGSLVGHTVLTEGDVLELTSAGAAGGMELASAADSVKVDVVDSDGNVVKTLDLGKQDAGLVRFAWDGKDKDGVRLTDGEYAFKVQATAAGKDVEATPYGLGSVLSVTLNDSGMTAEVAGLGMRGLDQIKQIF